MNALTRLVAASVAVLVVALLVATQVVSQEKPPAQQPGKPDQMAEMMTKWQELNAKGPEHKHFEAMVGTWDTMSRMWMAPGTEPTISKGTAIFRLMLDGRYIEQVYKCDMFGAPFEGRGIEGYDRFKKKYVSIWMDNMSTGMFVTYGTLDAAGKVFTYYGKADDPMTGEKDKLVKSVAREITDDKVVFEMFGNLPDGTEFKSMEITYTRRK
ncbi:MAG: DUF1579 domain-containing protein [Planctomycetes bacterium]|nr:DUF1579 domain-containing protein [Planctomycetota bacterium]